MGASWEICVDGSCAAFVKARSGSACLHMTRPVLQSQEMCSCLIPFAMALCNQGPAHKLPLTLLVSHYAYRSFVYPFWLQKPKPSPFHVWLAALTFVLYNSVLQVCHPTIIVQQHTCYCILKLLLISCSLDFLRASFHIGRAAYYDQTVSMHPHDQDTPLTITVCLAAHTITNAPLMCRPHSLCFVIVSQHQTL